MSDNSIEISPYGSLLVYKKTYTAFDVQRLIEENKLNGLRIFAHLKDDRLQDLNFLRNYSFLKELDISSIDDYDLSFLHSLKKLRALTIITRGTSSVDLSHLHNLETLTINWGKRVVSGLRECENISSLCLIKYFENNFLPISSLRKLKELKIKTASIDNVNGVNSLDNLEHLSFGYCKRLRSISDLSVLTRLKSLIFENCTKIRDYNSLGHLRSLENLELNDCREVNTLLFVKELSQLQKLSLVGNTNILDGDMAPAKNIKDVYYFHRNHYNVKIENERHEQLRKENFDKIKKLFK